MCICCDYGKTSWVRCKTCNRIREDVFVYPDGECVYCKPVKKDANATRRHRASSEDSK